MNRLVPFNIASVSDRELDNIRDVLQSRRLAGNGRYTHICQEWLQRRLGIAEVLLTQSCTAALEMAAVLCELRLGDEVIMPSFTFVSTANAVVLRGAVPVFVDIRRDTLNIDENLIEAAITPRTKAIYVVHYAGIPCEMDAINSVARAHGLRVVEDAAQALMSTYKGQPAGALGDLACFSFHDTKNIVSGEGGALATNCPELAARARIIWEKGTNRRAFLDGAVDKYSWVDIGSSYLPSELTAAFLAAQLERAEEITRDRLISWNLYHDAFRQFERRTERISRPTIPGDVQHNGHLYYLLLRDASSRKAVIDALDAQGVTAPFHYVPLHAAPAGKRFCRVSGSMNVTDDVARRLIRLPLWFGMGDLVQCVIDEVIQVLDR